MHLLCVVVWDAGSHLPQERGHPGGPCPDGSSQGRGMEGLNSSWVLEDEEE